MVPEIDDLSPPPPFLDPPPLTFLGSATDMLQLHLGIWRSRLFSSSLSSVIIHIGHSIGDIIGGRFDILGGGKREGIEEVDILEDYINL